MTIFMLVVTPVMNFDYESVYTVTISPSGRQIFEEDEDAVESQQASVIFSGDEHLILTRH